MCIKVTLEDLGKNNWQMPFVKGVSGVHFEVYKGRCELHIEDETPETEYLKNLLNDKLKEDDDSKWLDWDWCKAFGGKKVRYSVAIKDNNVSKTYNDLIDKVDSIVAENAKETVAKCEKFIDAIKEKERNDATGFNVLDSLSKILEPKHSKILSEILTYKIDGKYKVLESFFNNVVEIQENIVNPVVESEKDHVDVLITDNKDYAIIIENKIWDAKDGEEQIERYVFDVAYKKRGIPLDKIYCIYLTKDGSKKVETYSYTEKVRNALEGRFIPVNYKDDILPFLKNDVLPFILRKDYVMESSIVLLIDYFEGLFGLRERDKVANDTIRKNLFKNEFNNSENPTYAQVDKLSNELSILESILNDSSESEELPISTGKSTAEIEFDMITHGCRSGFVDLRYAENREEISTAANDLRQITDNYKRNMVQSVFDKIADRAHKFGFEVNKHKESNGRILKDRAFLQLFIPGVDKLVHFEYLLGLNKINPINPMNEITNDFDDKKVKCVFHNEGVFAKVKSPVLDALKSRVEECDASEEGMKKLKDMVEEVRSIFLNK